LAQKFNRRTTLEPTTNLSYEALHPPLRQTAVTSWRSVCRVVNVMSDRDFAVIVRLASWSLFVGCAVAALKFFEGKEILKNNFSCEGEVEALLQTLVCALDL
ncbi:hypothetical protein, partial [Flavobacterium cyanobacteriorum]|uniref:hypothetical protein n=1 Tax=Flavobacterium cyanobacteriorum TaxID=2022802 RepID=UPI001A9C3F3B